MEETAPDLDVIKQVEQVTTFGLAGVRRDSEHRDQRAGGRDCGIFNLLNIWFADVSLQKTAKTARSANGGRLQRGSPAMPPALKVGHYRSPPPLDLDAAPREDAGIV